MSLYALARPLLALIDPERAHALTVAALARGWGPKARAPDDPILAVSLWGKTFANPVGLAAGFDKDAEAIAGAFGLGFGFVEVGTITPEPQPGNPRPRVFRLAEDKAVINRYGFNSKGMAAAAERLDAFRAAYPKAPGPVGVNLGKNRESQDAAEDYAAGAARLAPFADYLAINVSSPNTPGLRALQGPKELAGIVGRVRGALRGQAPPLMLKISPDLGEDDRAAVAQAAAELKLDGLIVANTTVSRPPGLRSRNKAQAGGLSGAPLMDLSTEVLADMHRRTAGRIPLIGVGGIASGADAYAKIRAGASLVQLYTALVYEGPGLVARIKRELAALLRRDGHANIEAAVGADHRG
jgi:dihydroorotate dehydrogenase